MAASSKVPFGNKNRRYEKSHVERDHVHFISWH